MAQQPERLYQLGFNEHLGIIHHDVTPAGFTGLQFPSREPAIKPRLGRFVREAQEQAQIMSPAIAARYLKKHIFKPEEFDQFEQEELWLLLLNTKNYVIAESMLYRGTINSIYIRLPELFREAIRHNAVAIIMAHVHPSGNPEPSPEDQLLTMKAMEAAQFLELDLCDHLIIGCDDRWVSLKELAAKKPSGGV